MPGAGYGKMIMIKYTLIIIVFVVACNAEHEKKSSDKKTIDTVNMCEKKPIIDPNDPKPMAMMMRQLVINADSMKAQLSRGKQLDSLRYPFIRFYLAEPTDPSVLEPKFYENARLFQAAYSALFMHPQEQVKYYNLVINKCVNCHESYCSGPLKRIRKLYLN